MDWLLYGLLFCALIFVAIRLGSSYLLRHTNRN